jgi:hypothetical protein
MKKLFILALVALTAATLQAAPKKMLVVSTTTGFRHASIPALEKMLGQLATDGGLGAAAARQTDRAEEARAVES